MCGMTHVQQQKTITQNYKKVALLLLIQRENLNYCIYALYLL